MSQRVRELGAHRLPPAAIDRVTREVLERRSPFLLRFFAKMFERDLAASFDAVRCSRTLPPAGGPMVLFANHPSWWDGEIFVWLAATMFSAWRGFVPIEATMLDRYRFFSRLGAFGVKPGYAGAATFLAVGDAVLGCEDGLLLVNAEGRFRDVRARPLQVAAGLSHLASRAPTARFVPLAIEYAFWDDRRPNLLLRFGEPISPLAIRKQGRAVLQDALTVTMDDLSADARSRDPARFDTLLAGRNGGDPFYRGWRRAGALLRGRDVRQ